MSPLALILGGVFLYAVYLFYRKDWQWLVMTALMASVIFFVSALPATREFMRTTAWAAFVTSLEATGQGLLRLGNTIDDIRAGMEAEQNKRKEQQAELDRIQGDTRNMQTSLQTTQQKLNEQQQKLADINQLLKAFYEASTTKLYDTSTDSDRLVIMQHSDDRVTLYALLPDVPIPQTLQLQYHVAVQPRSTYFTDGNLVTFRWGQSETNLRSKPMEFTYVPDPTSNPKYSKLVKRGHRVFADERPLPYGFITNDPVVQKLIQQKGPSTQISVQEIEEALRADVSVK